MQLTLSHLGTNRETIQVNMLHASKLTGVHQSAWFSKVHNSVKLDVRSLEWDDTRCVTYAWGALDHNRKFSEIKCSKMLKLVHNLQCRSNFAERALLLDSSGQNSPISQRGDFIGDFYQQISQNFVTLPRLLWKRQSYHFMEYISLSTYTVKQKTTCS